MDSSPVGSEVRDAVAHMNEELRLRYEEIRRLLAQSTADDARARHRIGELIAAVKRSEARYGSRAVKTLARALGRDEATLYRFALVAEAWSAAELESLLARTTPRGEPLSWSHLVELAQMPNRTKRAEMLEYALTFAVSLRELTEAIVDDRMRRRERSDDGSTSASAGATLRRLVAACDAAHRKIGVDDELLAQIESAAPGTKEAIEALLEQLLASQRSVLKASAGAIEKLEQARRQMAPASDQAPTLRRWSKDDVVVPMLLAGGVSRSAS